MVDVLGGSPHKGWNGSLAPPIFSHSSAYALCPHPRNVPDDILQLVKERRSLVMVNFAPDFVSCKAADNENGMPDPVPDEATLAKVVEHIRHIGDTIGYDYVGIGSDFDGIPHGPKGLEDVSKFPDLVAEMLRQGVSDADAAKVVGRNLLRVWKEADEVAARLQNDTLPLEEDITDLHDFEQMEYYYGHDIYSAAA
jgi:membrane dipeptidase